MRLIDADALYDVMERRYKSSTDNERKAYSLAIDDICEAPTINPEWINVKDRLPEQHDSIFAKLQNTKKWKKVMWAKQSNTVLVTVKNEKHEKVVMTGRLQDGVWETDVRITGCEVTHWMPFPNPPTTL